MMDPVILSLGVFCGAVVSSFAGFAFSPVAGVFLVFFMPHTTALPLLMMCSILLQTITVVRFRQRLLRIELGPMMLGGAVGVLCAVLLLRLMDGAVFRMVFGTFLIAYCAVALWGCPGRLPTTRSRREETAVGLAGGLVGGLTATPGAVPVMYCNVRGYSKEDQRATVQPFILMMQSLALCLLISDGLLTEEALISFAIAVPSVLAGTAIGMSLFGRASEQQFRHVVIACLILSGVGLFF